jgi:hypothetical protein
MINRQYLQFNHLVFDGYKMLSTYDSSASFKRNSIPYSFFHGSYSPLRRSPYVQEQVLTLSLVLDIDKLRCDEDVNKYKNFVKYNLSRPGLLWAVDSGRIIYTRAYVTDYDEVYEINNGTVDIDVSFVLYDGIWTFADEMKVFLQDYTPCNFIDCTGFISDNPLEYVDTCGCCCDLPMIEANTCQSCGCECESITQGVCGLGKQVITGLTQACYPAYKIIYDCEKGNQVYGYEKMLGKQYCKTCNEPDVIAVSYESGTILDTNTIVITLEGYVKNPVLTINGNMLIINGEYDGTLTIDVAGQVYFTDSCCNTELIPPDDIIIPNGSTLGFTIKNGHNSIIMETNNCCETVCMYVKVNEILY